MIKAILKFLRDYANGNEANLEFHVTWWQLAAFIVTLGLAIYLIVR